MSSLTKTFLHWTPPLRSTLLPLVQLLQPFENLCNPVGLPVLSKLAIFTGVNTVLFLSIGLEINTCKSV